MTATAQAPILQDAYLRAKVFSASPEELRLMLIDGALRFTRQAREALVARNAEVIVSAFANARAILLELATSISPETEETLRGRITGVYMFIYRRLVDASLEKNPAIVDEALSLLEYERETWALYMQRLAQAPDAPAPAAAPAADPPGATTRDADAPRASFAASA